MKIQELKQEVFSLTCTTNTQQLRKERPELTEGRDLRYKEQWTELLEKLKVLREQGQDMSLSDLEQSEQMLKESLFEVGHIAGLSNDKIEIDWQRIKLEAQFGDVHIEEL
jgi:ribosomal protein L29